MNENHILYKCQEGDKSAQRVLFDLYYNYVYSICHRYIQHHHDTEDIVSIVFNRIFKNIHKHRTKELHVGSVTEDFYHAFGLGDGEKRILTIDPDGILMLAVQALKSENDALQSKLKDLQKQIDQLK